MNRPRRTLRVSPSVLLVAAWCVLLGLAASLFDSHGVAEGAWVLKKAVGRQWRNGSRLLAAEFGRGHTEIKGLLATKPSGFQEHYKQLAAEFADATEAKAKGVGSPMALEEKLQQIKQQAGQLISELLGPLASAGGGRDGSSKYKPSQQNEGPSDVVLDPMQLQMAALQQRQEDQRKQLLAQLQNRQEEERAHVEQQLVEAREKQMVLQHESQAIQSLLFNTKAGIDSLRSNLHQLSQSGTTIDDLTGRIGAALSSVSQQAHQGQNFPDPSGLQSLEAEATQIKMGLGKALGEVNSTLQTLAEQLTMAQSRSDTLSTSGSSGRTVAQRHLQTCASFRVSVDSLESFLRELVGQLEMKQLGCDASIDTLRSALGDIYVRSVETFRTNSAELASSAEANAQSVCGTIFQGAAQLTEQLEVELNSALTSGINYSTMGKSMHHVQSLFLHWNRTADQAIGLLDTIADSAQKLLTTTQSLPPTYQAQIDPSQIHQTLRTLNSAKADIRQERAKIQQLLQVLEGRYRQSSMQLAHPAMAMQHQRAAGEYDVTPVPLSETYSAYALPAAVGAAAGAEIPFPSPGMAGHPMPFQYQQQTQPMQPYDGMPQPHYTFRASYPSNRSNK